MEAPSGEEAKVKTSRDESKAAAVRDTELQLTVEGIMKNLRAILRGRTGNGLSSASNVIMGTR